MKKIDGILGSSYELSRVIRKIYEEISKVMDTSNFYIAVYRQREEMVEFEIYTIGGKEVHEKPRKLGKGLTEYVITSKKPLRINSNVKKYCRKLGIKPHGRNSKSWLGVPMIYRGGVEGVMTIQDYRHEKAYDAEDELFLTSIAAKAAVVIANTRLVQEEMKHARELAMMNQVVHRLTRSLNVEEICASVTKSILENFKNFNVAIFLLEKDELVLKKLSRGFRDEVPRDMRIGLDRGIVGYAVRKGRTIVVPDVRRDPHYVAYGQTSTKSEVAILLKISKKLIGMLDIQCNEANGFDPNTVRILELIGDRLSVAFHNARLFEDATSHAKELSVSFAIAQSLISTLDLDDVLNRILEVIRITFGYENCAILLIDKKTNELYIKAAHGYPDYIVKNARLNVDKKEGITGHVAATGKPFYAADVSKVPFYVHGRSTVKSEAAVPLIIKNELIGVLDVESDRINAFREKDLRMFSIFASQAAIAIENARLYNETRTLSLTDSLTRVANRRHFDLMLENEIRRGRGYSRPVSLAMIDIDDFKGFNDRFGHPAGDKMLIAVARKLKDTVRDTDFVARYGGEEFTIIFPETNNVPALKVCERVRIAVEQNAIEVKGAKNAAITVSIGIATYPHAAKDSLELIQKSDKALYRAKKLGKNRVEMV
jgi:diguanylate cyclase (GGDEF)-like protein